jgi:putative heme-binding domain-containing protein
LPPIIKKHLDLTSGRDRGRIYRITWNDFQQADLPVLGSLDAAELVPALGHTHIEGERDIKAAEALGPLGATNGWRRDTTARLLYQRQDRSAVAALNKLANRGLPESRVHALYALDGLNALSWDVVLSSLRDNHPQLRRHAVRCAERVLDSPAVREQLYSMTEDEDIRVVYQLAFTLGELTGPKRNQALAAIARRYPDEKWIRVAVMSSLNEGAGDVLAELAADPKLRHRPAGASWIETLAAQIGRQQRPEDVAAVIDVLRKLREEKTVKTTMQTVVRALAAKPGSPLAEQLAAATEGESEKVLHQLFETARRDALDEKTPPQRRKEAVHRLRFGAFGEAQPVLAELLRPAQAADMQAAALATLATFTSPEVADLLVQRWPGLSPSLRSQAAEALFSREAWIPALLTAVEQGRIAPGDLQPGRLKLLAETGDAAIREQARRILDQTQSSQRGEVVEQYRAALEMEGDLARGKAAFLKHCSKCHRLEGQGFDIGPNLAAMQNRGPEAILTNVLDPNREVNPQYLNYVLITQDGRSFSGAIAAETATSVTLRRAENAQDTVLRIDIDELRSTGQSLMPEGMEKEIDVQGLADVMAYLHSIK